MERIKKFKGLEIHGKVEGNERVDVRMLTKRRIGEFGQRSMNWKSIALHLSCSLA